MADESGQAVLGIFDKLLQRIKQTQPVRTDGKPLGGGYVYSMLPLGMPIDPQDFMNPWTPQGDTNIKDAVAAKAIPTAPPPAAGAAPVDPATAPPFVPDPEQARQMAAAFKTAVLCTNLLQVTSDGSYLEYPTGQHLDFAYNSIITAMQPVAPNEAPDPNVVAAITAARKVLFLTNPDGTFTTKQTPAYQNYNSNTIAYGQATRAFAEAYAAARSDPVQFQAWPVTSRTYQNAVDIAKDKLIADGGPDVEAALDTLASKGNPIQAHMIAQAKELYDQWDLGLSGAVPAKMPYCMILPSGWADPDDKNGWEQLTIDSSSYGHKDVAHATQSSDYSWMSKRSSNSGGGGISFGFGMVGGSASTSSGSDKSNSSAGALAVSSFKNQAKNLNISLWFALVDIERPWLMSDLFYMQGYYLLGDKKNSISDGTIANQVANAKQHLPMIPKQMLLIKDVSISTSDWGDAGDAMRAMYRTNDSDTETKSVSASGSGGICLGPIAFGGSASHSDSTATGQGASFAAQDRSGDFHATFDGETLHIPGAQIIAFLSDIVPASAPLDDPEFGKVAPAPTTQPAAQPQLAGAAH